ncbi:hypothetical protein MKZ15_15565 [Paenibacillus sp. FSL R7-0216]|uniref:hypothetical protein n=1 Tax=Paenibacillus sp. FSL R7-0216 TaxID=2921677 RepID=UPI0030D73B17
MQSKMSLEEEVRFVARNAARNLRMIQKNPDNVSPDKLQSNIDYLEMMVRLHKSDLKAQKNARRAGQALRLRTRQKALLSFILPDGRRKSKEGTA